MALTSTSPFSQAAYLDAADKLVHARRLEDAETVLNTYRCQRTRARPGASQRNW
jgi:hypothetical protein